MQTEDPLGYWAYRGGRQVSRWIQKMDQFGQPITLSFQGRAHYTTCPTGFMTLFIVLATLFFAIGELDKLIETEAVALGYFEQLATPDEAGLNYTLSDAENMTMSLEFQPAGSWVNKDGVTNDTIKERVHEVAKMLDVTATIYNKNTSRGTSAKQIGWPILQENFTEVLSINSHENWEMKVDLQDMIMSGSRDFYNQVNQFSTTYDFQMNKYKMYREAYFRCLSKRSCGGLLPDEGTMVNAEFDNINTNPYLSAALK